MSILKSILPHKNRIYFGTLAFIFFLTFLLSIFTTAEVFAISKAQKNAYDSGVRYFEVSESCTTTSASDPTSTNGGGLYMVGDSITLRSKDDLEKGFKAKNFQPFINASVSRAITRPGITDGYKTSGLQAVEDDKDRVKSAAIIVVALGTNNTDANFEQAIKELVNKIQAYNSEAPIFWVNVFSPAVHNKDQINKTLENLANERYRIIDTTTANIAMSGDDLHPSIPEGAKQFAKVVADGVGSADAQESAGSAQCCSEDGSSQLTGSNNEERIWNFFIDHGLTPEQTAGIVGNFSVESHFNPFQQEIGKSPPIGGFGIAQWTGTGRPRDPAGARRLEMIKAMKAAGLDVDLGLETVLKSSGNNKALAAELEYAWKEAKDGGIIAQLKKQTTVRGAVDTWIELFERPQSYDDTDRLNAANDAMTLYGSSGGGSSGSTSDTNVCATGDNGDLVGDYSLPVPKHFYDEHPEWFTSPHHDYPADDIPVGSGTKVFAVAKGKVTEATNYGYGGGAGTHVFITAGNIVYGYFHGTPGSLKVGVGDTVEPGQLLMYSDNTGHTFGPHLHFQIEVGGTKVCPQSFLDAIGKGKDPPDISSLPTSGCIGG
jgi:murein DD-endopeptidase MepM/ murein hydrolase activator NlpD